MEPNVISYSSAISARSKGQQWEQALSSRLEPNVISYSSAISACSKGQQWEQALSLLSEMRSSWLQPDVISYNSAISACDKGRQWEQALSLCIEDAYGGSPPPSWESSNCGSMCKTSADICE